MSKEEKKSGPLITLMIDVGERSFFSIDELSDWQRNEVNSFNWITNATKSDTTAATGWNNIRGWLGEVDSFIKQFQQHSGNDRQQQQLISNLENQTHNSITNGHIITSNSPHAKFVFSVKDNNSGIVAAYALNYLLKTKNVNFNSAHALEGAFVALQYLYGNSETVESNRSSLEELMQEWNTKFTTQFTNQSEKNTKQIDEFENFKSTFSSIQSDIAKEKNKQIEDFDKIIINSSQKLSNIEQTYDSKLATAASVNYWKKKKYHHQTVMFVMGFVTLLFSLGTGVLFAYIAHDLLKESISSVPLWKLGVVFAISTFGIWLTRLTTKIFISNLHLRTDADERTTMIQTYLALLREGSGPKDDERQLILQTLFRPSSTGFIKDDGSSSFHDTIVNFFKTKNTP